MQSSYPECKPFCKHFRCDMKPSQIRYITKGGRKVVWCTMVDDECDGAWCQYGACMDHRMTSEGTCKPVGRPQDVEENVYDEEFVDPASIPRRYVKKLKQGKA